MTAAAIKGVAAKYTPLAIYFDNDQAWYFTNGETLTDDNFEVIDGVEFIKRKSFINSSKGGPNGGISKKDIPVWAYKPVDAIQGILTLENAADMQMVDKRTIYFN